MVFAIIGKSPSRFVAEGDFSAFSGLYYRFQKDIDIIRLFEILRTIQIRFGSIGTMISHHFKGDTRNTLWAVREDLLGRQGQEELPFFFPKPGSTSPLKRWNLYFRWMVRYDDIDLGIWDFVDKRTLTIPLDTHIFKIARCLRWSRRASPTWNTARDVTEALRTICPEDPLKYDFFLCHGVGIAAQCTGSRNSSCRHICPIYEVEERL